MIKYKNKNGDFTLENACDSSGLYFPMGNEHGVMGCITPSLHGDSKTGQNTFLLEPVSIENLHSTNMGRNMWFRINQKELWAINGSSPYQTAGRFCDLEDTSKADQVQVSCGKLFHQVERENKNLSIRVTVLNYVPLGQQVEVMKVTVENIGNESLLLEPTVAIPLYGRSADNMRDHRHVTSLLHRIKTTKEGICVKPTLSFDERGHGKNEVCYGVYACDEQGQYPSHYFPVLESFIGEGGNLTYPKALFHKSYGEQVKVREGIEIAGFEAIGGLGFSEIRLLPEEKRTYLILLSYNNQGLELLNFEQEAKAFDNMKAYWKDQTGITIETGNPNFDQWLKWVGIQPTLRRIFGCSFLPHHDYGRGGRGYRDLWQDSLALLLNSKESIRDSLTNYYRGVRMDGSNATIIGNKPGEFIADRNSIVRMWMDHGLWPFITTLLYINQTGDLDILLEEKTYFKDAVICRGSEKDGLWNEGEKVLHTRGNEVYEGTILEHILIQNLTAFYDVGEHGHMKLLGADWNDALDMAKEHGESIAFSAAYAGNLENLSNLILQLEKKKKQTFVYLLEEVTSLLSKDGKQAESIAEKQELLKNYCNLSRSYISGKKIKVSCVKLAEDLHQKAEQIKKLIRKTQWLQPFSDTSIGWFNSYYDNSKNMVEGVTPNGIRMMLTGQVFTIMSQTATDEQISMIVKAADQYLFDEKVGGYRLNTDFKELKTDLGRMFGFAYGSKENGAVFSHMAVMYAFALYKRGFVKEGYKALNQLYLQSSDFEHSRIYPGIPEYFNQNGRGLYSYLTGAASWYMLTVLTEMFGVKGKLGDLSLEPKLMAEQFDEKGKASITSFFAERTLRLEYENPGCLEIGDYEIEEIWINDVKYLFQQGEAIISRETIQMLNEDEEHIIRVILA
jgi:cellobiose phosphorylase